MFERQRISVEDFEAFTRLPENGDRKFNLIDGEIEVQTVQDRIPGQPPRTLTLDDTLDGGDILSGFTLPVRMIFEIDDEA